MNTKENICEQLKSVLDSLSPGEERETPMEEGLVSLNGWNDFYIYCKKEHKKTVKTEFNQDTWSCTILKKADASVPAPEPVVEPEPDPLTETVEVPVVDVEVEKEPEPEPKSSFWGNQG